MAAMLDRLTIVIVTFNSAAVVGGLLQTIVPGTDIVVVDNASSDATVDIVARYAATLVQLDENKGFGVACNAGAARSSREFLFFLNPDARLEAATVERLIGAADRYPDAAGFNPVLLDDAGTAVLRAPSRFLNQGRRRHKTTVVADCDVDVLSGAALFCRRAIFNDLGGFDEHIFLYFEDDDLSLRLLSRGHRLMHIHDAAVHHAQGRSSPPSPALTYFKNYHWMKSYRWVAEKHGHRFPAYKTWVRHALRYGLNFMTGNKDARMMHAGRLAGLTRTKRHQ
jgi:N-acetylglucosaminyl-diphospho-decaprenol L-rhamnosyltransferase